MPVFARLCLALYTYMLNGLLVVGWQGVCAVGGFRTTVQVLVSQWGSLRLRGDSNPEHFC